MIPIAFQTEWIGILMIVSGKILSLETDYYKFTNHLGDHCIFRG